VYSHSFLSSLGTKPLSITVLEILNGECEAMVHMTKEPLNKLTKVKGIHFGTSCTTSYKLSIVTFALGRTV